jgi:hypothetical protein
VDEQAAIIAHYETATRLSYLEDTWQRKDMERQQQAMRARRAPRARRR